MLTKVKKYIIPFFKQAVRASYAPTFFQLARKNAIKKKKGAAKTLSGNIDKIVYGI